MRKEENRDFQSFLVEAKIYQQQQNCSAEKEESNSSQSFSSSSPSDLMEDASSSSSDGPLYQLSDLMAQLPIKRGLSKHYHGKSESFASLANVEKLEDLPKRENPYRKRIKFSNNTQKLCSPKATIAKKTSSYSNSRGCFSSSPYH